MPDLSLVINLGSSSLKAALVDSTGAPSGTAAAVWLLMNRWKRCLTAG